jgi:hypothetical protein
MTDSLSPAVTTTSSRTSAHPCATGTPVPGATTTGAYSPRASGRRPTVADDAAPSHTEHLSPEQRLAVEAFLAEVTR